MVCAFPQGSLAEYEFIFFGYGVAVGIREGGGLRMGRHMKAGVDLVTEGLGEGGFGTASGEEEWGGVVVVGDAGAVDVVDGLDVVGGAVGF